MIKKLFKCFLTIWLIWLWIINFSNSANIYKISSVWTYTQSLIDTSVNVEVLKYWNVLSELNWITKKLLYFNAWNYFFWWEDWIPYVSVYYNSNTSHQWKLWRFYNCDFFDWNFVSTSSNPIPNCPSYESFWNYSGSIFVSPNTWSIDILWSFMANYVTNEDNILMAQYTKSSKNYNYFCISSKIRNSSICFQWYNNGDLNSNIIRGSSLWLPSGATFWNILSTYLYDPPSTDFINPDIWWWDWGNWNQSSWIILWSNESAINYFEKTYWWNEKICYVWVDSVDYMYWTSWISFEEWSWLSIFDTFEDLYWNRDLDKVYVWLNVWLFNYENWVWTSWNPSWLARYNSWTNQINVYYDNLTTSPFINQPVALWFMTSNIEVSYNTPYNTMGADVVSYCNIKINWWTFDEIQGDAIKDAITWYTEQSNKNKWLNPDWSVNVIDYSWFWTYTGDAWLSSGVNVAFSWNTTIKNTIENFFTTFDDALSWLDVNTSYRILPTWLVYIFIFIVLFKIFRKK